MANLPKYELSYDERRKDWALKEEGATRAKRRFDKKADATKGGVLASAVGEKGGSVRIKTKDSKRYQEERTFPRNADPKKSKG